MSKSSPRMQIFRTDVLPSLNVYAKSKQIRIQGHSETSRMVQTIGWHIKQQRIQPVETYPVDIIVTGYFLSKHLIDTTNLAGAWKIIEDAMVRWYGILQADSSGYTGHVILRPPVRIEPEDERGEHIEVVLAEGADIGDRLSEWMDYLIHQEV